MEEVILRVTGVTTWLILALMGYGLFIHDRRKWGKACLAASLVALSVMALQPWGTQQAIFDSIAPEHGHTHPGTSTSPPSNIESFESPSSYNQVDLHVGETKLGEVYMKTVPRVGKPVVVSFH